MLTLYAAMRISPALILRLSYPLWEIAGMLAMYGVGLLCLFLVLYILQRRTLGRFGKDLMLQMDEVRRLLEGDAGHSRAVFPELQPALDNISYLAKRLKDDLNEVSRNSRALRRFCGQRLARIAQPVDLGDGLCRDARRGHGRFA